MRSMLLPAACLTLTLGLVLSGCSGGSADSAEDAATLAETAAIAPAGDVEAGSEQAAALAATLVTPADVERVSGLTGLKVVPKDPGTGAGGDTNIATSSGDLVFMLNVGDGDFYEQTKSGPNYGRDHSGIGDESYVGPAKDIMPEEYLLGVKSGKWGVVLTSFLDLQGSASPILTIPQLQQLGDVAISRL